jgi:hypothetical protein
MRVLAILITLWGTQYQKTLVYDIHQVIKSHKECTQKGYDKIYKDISIMGMLTNNLDFRYQATMALRERCNGMRSTYEVK